MRNCVEVEPGDETTGRRHCWESRGLDVNARGVLVDVRRCVWCGTYQERPYGARRGSWRAHRAAPVGDPERWRWSAGDVETGRVDP